MRFDGTAQTISVGMDTGAANLRGYSAAVLELTGAYGANIEDLKLIGSAGNNVNDGNNNTTLGGTITIPEGTKDIVVVNTCYSLNNPSVYFYFNDNGTIINQGTFYRGGYWGVHLDGTEQTIRVGMNTGEANLRGYSSLVLGF